MMPDPSHARPLRWLLLVALFIVVLGGYAHAQVANTSADSGLYVTIVEPDEAGKVGEIVHHNRETLGRMGSDFYEFETSRGLVVLHLDTTPNTECAGPNRHGCPDTLTVWELPGGIMASALEVVTPERETTVITLFEWTGM
jgi:hypothetical protein